MNALLLAAGRGERLRPFTDTCPKPLLEVGGRPLIEWHLEALAAAGVRDVVINTAWLEDRFPAVLGDGSRWGLRITYSMEGRDHGGALETAGGIAKALPLLGEVFWVVSADIHMPGFGFERAAFDRFAARDDVDGQLWMIEDAHYPQGDFGIDDAGLLSYDASPRLTYANVALFQARLFRDIVPGTRLPLRPVFDRSIALKRLAGMRFRGPWTNVGTVAEWRQIDPRADTP